MLRFNMEIALNTYSIRQELEQLGDFPQTVVKICKDLAIQKVEYLDSHFKKEELPSLVKLLKDNAIELYSLGSHCKFLVKPNEIEAEAEKAIEWLHLAHANGIKYIRFQMNSGTQPPAFPPMDDFDEEEWEDYNEMIDQAIEETRPSIEKVLPVAEELGIFIGIETHGSFSSNYLYMQKFNETFQSKNLGWVYDIGNYENDEMRFKALDVLKDKIFYLHAKSYNYDENGFESSQKKVDFPKAAKILKEQGFDGVWSIEFEGKYNGILGLLQSNEWCKYAFAQAESTDYKMKTEFGTPEALIAKYQSK